MVTSLYEATFDAVTQLDEWLKGIFGGFQPFLYMFVPVATALVEQGFATLNL